MTMVCCDTPITRPELTRIPTPGGMAKAAAGRLADSVNRLARGLADGHRRRRDAAALAALPLDLRKDLGWPAGDMRG